ncbi:MAG: outer membrane protein assembly factor [Candidatus Obscuribacterales bacterium]
MTKNKSRRPATEKNHVLLALSSFVAFSLTLGPAFNPWPGPGEGSAARAQESPRFNVEIEDDEVVDDGDDKSADEPETSAEEKTKTDVSGDSGKNLKVDDIRIEGNRLVATEDITNVLKTKRGDSFDRSQVVEDLRAINEMGYFDDKSLQVVPELSGGGVLLKIRVQENAPVTQFSFQGNDMVSTEDISKIFADQLGKPQNLSHLSGSIEKLEQMYHDKGYVLARVTDVKEFPDGSVSLSINEGQVEKIEISGNRKTKDFIIRNNLRLKEGTTYNEAQLTSDLRKLYANGYFQDIRRSLVPSEEDPNKFVLKIEVDEKRTGSVGIGGGVDSIAGPFGSLSFSDSNFRGKGQVVSFNSQVGSGMFNNVTNSLNNGGTSYLPNQRTYQLEANWTEPSLKGTKTSLSVSGFGRNYTSLMIDQAAQRTLGGSVTLSRPFKENFRLNLGLLGENTNLKDLGSYFNTASTFDNMTSRALQLGKASSLAGAEQLAGQVREDQLKGGTFMTLNPSVTYDTRDAYIDPSKGTYARLSAGPSLGLTGSSFMKAGASVSKFIPLGKSTTLALNAQGGSALGGIPQFAQYRLGGWNGIRGYRQFSDLGTGSSMLMATAEIRTRLPLPKTDNKLVKAIDEHVKLAGFIDVGGVGGNGVTNSLLGRGSMGGAVGVGIRIKMPMLGLVRLDYGIPFLQAATGSLMPRLTVGFGEKF